jgi:putative ABC transport system permease protein
VTARARKESRLELGSIDVARQEVAEGRTGFVLEQSVRDALYAMRGFRRAPAMPMLSIATMGIGIGVSTMLFALVSSILLQPLAYPEPDALVQIFDNNQRLAVARAGAASGNIDDWRRRSTRFEGIAGFYSIGRTLSIDADAEVVITTQVSEDFFPLFRVSPLLGRTFSEEETRRSEFNNAAAPVGPDPVAVIAYWLWQRQFGGDPAIIGRTVTLERRPFRVIGVMPDGFAMPDRQVQIWIPWDLSRSRPRDQHYLMAIGRLKDGVSIAEGEADLNRVARDLGREHPATNAGWTVSLSSLHAETVGDSARVLWVLLAAVGLVLLVACANVALLSLMRGLDRSEESAVRLALGASSSRLLREFLIESSLLAACGGALGAVIAVAGLRALPYVAPDLPRLDEVALDQRALLFIAAVTIVSAMVSGVPPAWRRTRTVSIANLASGALRTTEAPQRHVLRDGIVVVQVALAVVLLAGSGLLVRSFVHLRAAHPGFDPRGVLVLPIFLDMQAYGTGDRVRSYYATLLERLGAIPGVVAVGGSTSVPTSPLGPNFERPVWREDAGSDTSVRTPASVRIVTPGYFPALRLGILDGRSFDAGDRPDAPGVVMVSETLAKRLWPGQRAVGQRLVVDYSTTGTYPYEVVGVVNDVRFAGPRSAPLAEIFLAHAQRSYLILNVTMRSSVDPRMLVPTVRRVLKELDPHKPAHGVYPLEDLVDATIARDRQAMLTLLVFAAAAVGLAIVSVYGVLSQRVRERSREIGIRIAMGASRSQVIGWVATRGLWMIGGGIAIGLMSAWTMTGALSGLLFGVRPTDPLVAVASVGVLAGVGLVAALLPSWRATRIDPVAILRRG